MVVTVAGPPVKVNRVISTLRSLDETAADESYRDLKLLELTTLMNPRYEPAAVHRYLAAILEQVEELQLDRVYISFPPRHGKTELASINFPAYFIGRDGRRNVIHVSYAQRLAEKNSRRTRN